MSAPGTQPRVLFAVTEDWYFRSHRKPLAAALARAGCTIAIATRFNHHYDELRDAGFRCIPLTFERSLRHPWRDARAMFGLAAAVRDIRPDIVHLVSLKPILLSALALRDPNTRFVAAFTGMGYLFTSRDRRARPVQRAVIAVLRRLLRRPNVWIVVQNGADRDLLRTHRLGDPARTVLIPGVGVDTVEFAPARAEPSGVPVVVLPARLIRDKGIEEFVAAARRVRAERDARFVLVGACDPDNPAAIGRDVIDAWVASGVIEWWGHRDDMPAVYRAAHVVCLPSYREGLPKVLLEAAACGLPLVATDVPGCREVCRDGETGVLVAPRDADPLARAIGRLLASPDERRRFGAAARELVEREFSLSRITRETLDFYHRVRGH